MFICFSKFPAGLGNTAPVVELLGKRQSLTQIVKGSVPEAKVFEDRRAAQEELMVVSFERRTGKVRKGLTGKRKCLLITVKPAKRVDL